MGEMLTKVAAALEQSFKTRVAASASAPGKLVTFEETGVIAPGPDVWQAYAEAAVAAVESMPYDPYTWTKVWWDAETGTIRRTPIDSKDVRL